MMFGQSYLLSANELRIIAAASGMNEFLIFDTQPEPSKEQQVQSILRLINDGFIVSGETSLTPGEELVALLEMLNQATTAVVAKLLSNEAAPECIYYEESCRKFLRLTPHNLKKGTFEVKLVDKATLFSDFQCLGFLPELREEDVSSGVETKWHADSEMSSNQSVDADALSTFDKYDLSQKRLVESASVGRLSYAWGLTTNSGGVTMCGSYSHCAFMAWLKGALR